MRGAREHNLKNVDVQIPRDQLTVITGLSGSGKSSLAFDTIYAEGQRRYVESLSAYARQFLELMGKPDVDSIEGLSPAISIEQKTTSRNPRSTVGTVTEIHDYMRLLWARAGVPYSPATGLPIEAQTVSQMVDRVMAMPEGTRLLLLAPVVRDRKGEYRKELAELQRRGFTRAKVDGTLYEIADVPALNRKTKHEIEAVVDRIVVRAGIESRLADSFETALAHGGRHRLCRDRRRRGGADGVLLPLRLPGQRLHHRGDRAAAVLLQLARTAPARPATAWAWRRSSTRAGGAGRAGSHRRGRRRALGRRAERVLRPDAQLHRAPLQGHHPQAVGRAAGARARRDPDGRQEPIEFTYKDGVRAYSVTKPFEGVLHNLQRRWQETDSAWVREEMSRYQAEKPCAVCNGARLKPEALAVRVGGEHIAAASDLSIRRALAWFAGVEATLTPQRPRSPGASCRRSSSGCASWTMSGWNT